MFPKALLFLYIYGLRKHGVLSLAVGVGAQDEAKLIVGYTANEMQELKDAESPLFEARLNDIKCRSYLFKLKVSEETWNDEQRIRINVSRWVPSSCLHRQVMLSWAPSHTCPSGVMHWNRRHNAGHQLERLVLSAAP